MFKASGPRFEVRFVTINPHQPIPFAAMLLSKASIILSLPFTVRALSLSSLFGVRGSGKQTCDPSCYADYRSLMGDAAEDLVLAMTSSYRNTADDLCSDHECSECDFCDVTLTGRFPILSLQNVELNRIANAEARTSAGEEKVTTCTDCQLYLNNCERPHEGSLRYNPPRYQLATPYPLHTTDHQRTLQCELQLCTAGPLHCGVNGACEREICKDLADRAGLLEPAHTIECKDCLKSWVRCIHDRCIPPTLDGLADSLRWPNCFKNHTQCQQQTWQEINASLAPDGDCVESCRVGTPTYCQTGSCALPFRSSGTRNSTSLSLKYASVGSESSSRVCNDFRDTCLETCDMGNAHLNCERKCERLHGMNEGFRESCEETCGRRTCWTECRDMTCCIGPEQCREGGEAYRCNNRLRCEKYRKMMDDGNMMLRY